VKSLLTIDALNFCALAVRDISGSNGRPDKARIACHKFLDAYAAGTATGLESIPVAGILLKQFFTESSLTDENSKETLKSAVNLAKTADFDVTDFGMSLILSTALGEMAVEMNRQNGGADE
jgi:hypothetical protein